MIHTRLNLTRPLIVTDTETTGVDQQSDRVIELGFQVWTADGLKSQWRSLVNPGVPIPPASTEVHGITDADMLNCRLCGKGAVEHPNDNGLEARCEEFKPIPTFAEMAQVVARGFSNCDFAGKHVRFDLGMLAAEFRRAKVDWTYVGARVVDGDRLEALLNPRSLSHLYKKYTGQDLEDAHSALADVQATTTVITHQMDATVFNTADKLPRDLDALHALQWPGWVDSEGKFAFVKGVPCFTRWGKHANKPMRSVDVGYWDFILKSDMSPEIKRLAGEAKLGRFPVEAKVVTA